MNNENPDQEKLRYGKVMAIEAKLSRIYHDDYGRELPDPDPIAPPVGYFKQPSMFDNIRAAIAQHASIQAAEQGLETFEEANDFEVGDDYEPETPYEQMGREGELGPLPPEVANWTPAERRAFAEGRVAQAQAEHLKNNPPAAERGGGVSQTPDPSPTQEPTSKTGPASSPAAPPAGKLGQ